MYDSYVQSLEDPRNTRLSLLRGKVVWLVMHTSLPSRTPWTVMTVMPMKTSTQIKQICPARNLTPKPGPLSGTCVSERTRRNTSITWIRTPPSTIPRPDPCVKTHSRIPTRTPQSESVYISYHTAVRRLAAEVCDCVNLAKLTVYILR